MQILEHLSWIDGAVVLGYIAVTALLGLAFHRQSSSTEFLLANRGMGWLPVGLSVMATLFSANSFLMVPGETFRYNLLFGVGLVGIVCTVPIVMRWFIPIYVGSGCFTAYELLEKRFDVRVRLFAAALFILLRTGWMAAATFACSLAVAVISGTDLFVTIWVMGIVTTIYTVTGGIKAVMWNDVIQFGVFAVAITGAVCIAVANVPGGWSGTWASYEAAGKFQFVDPRLDLSLRMGSWALLIGGFVENLSAYATDQSLVQRYLTATSLKVCRRAFIVNIAGVLVVIPGLMILGAALSSFYQAHPRQLVEAPIEYFLRKPADLQNAPALAGAMAARHQVPPAEWIRQAKADPAMLRQDLTARYEQDPRLAAQDLCRVNRQDEAMPLFVRRQMPRGMIGLVIAALLAATMSSIAGGIHSIATSLIIDVKGRLLGRASEPDSPDDVRFIRVLTLILGITATALACVVNRLGPVFDMNKKLNGSFSGPLLAMFTLAFFVPRARALPVLVAAALGTGFAAWLTSRSEVQALPTWLTSTGTVSPMWFCVVGCLTTLVVGHLGSLLVPSPRQVARTAKD
jgi:Na+/proline symporter